MVSNQDCLSRLPTTLYDGMTTIGNGVSAVAHGLSDATNSVEGRSYTHLFLSGIIKIVEVSSSVLPGPLQLFSTIIDTTEGAFSAWDLFTVGRYFFQVKPPESIEPRIVKDPKGNLRLKKKNEGMTQAAYHVDQGKYLKVAAKVGSVVKAVGAMGLFLNMFKIVDLASLSASLSHMGTVGSVVSKLVHPTFVAATFGVGGIILFGALTLDSAVYLASAVSDPEKSMTKGLINLASRVALLALFIVTTVGVFNPYVLIPLMVAGGACGIAGVLYNAYRERQKDMTQKQNIQEMKAKFDGGGN